MVTSEKATMAKNSLKARLGQPSWLRGIGVSLGDKGYYVRVNVSTLTPEIWDQIPSSIEGVKVQILSVGNITPQSGE